MAEGEAELQGTGTTNHWVVVAHTVGSAGFAPGPAVATALAVTYAESEATDAHQWLVNIAVAEE